MIDLIFSGRNLFILYLVLAGRFLNPLMPCNTSRIVSDSIVAHHIIGFFTLLFLIVVTDTDVDNYVPFGTVLLTAAIIYAWFILSSRMTANWWIALVALLGGIYLLDFYQEKAKTMLPDIDLAKTVMLGASVLITLIGFLIYVGEKKLDYKSKFDYGTLLLGTLKCQNTPNIRPYSESLYAAFFMTPTSKSVSQAGGAFEGIPLEAFRASSLE